MNTPSMSLPFCLIFTVDIGKTTRGEYIEDVLPLSSVFHNESFKSNQTRKCGNYSDVLPLKAARRDSINSEGG